MKFKEFYFFLEVMQYSQYIFFLKLDDNSACGSVDCNAR